MENEIQNPEQNQNKTETSTPQVLLNNEVVKVNMKRVKIIITTLTVLLLVIGGIALQLYFKARSGIKGDNTEANIQENKIELAKLIETVGKLIELPTGEEPTLATVSDPEKLKDQAFFKNAVLGDKVLIYAGAKRAILYSPSRGKIIEVAPVNLTAPQQTTVSPAPALEATTTVKKP